MKKFFVVACVLSAALLCGGCAAALSLLLPGVPGPGLGDWTYELPNGYALWHIHSGNICLVKDGWAEDTNIVIGPYIFKFCYNERYVCVQQAEPPADAESQPDLTSPKYYIVDTQENARLGPYGEGQWQAKCDDMGIAELCPWIRTKPAPEGAAYG